jgi:hypothetical protein
MCTHLPIRCRPSRSARRVAANRHLHELLGHPVLAQLFGRDAAAGDLLV